MASLGDFMILFSEMAGGNGIACSVTGILDGDALYHAKVGLNERFPRISEWYFAFVDLSAVTQFDITAAHLEKIADQDRKLARFARPGLPVAIVVQGDLGFGISRMWQAASELTGWDTQVFRDRARAIAWLRHQVLTSYAIDLPQLLDEPNAEPPAVGKAAPF
jgi:hypothetical protein